MSEPTSAKSENPAGELPEQTQTVPENDLPPREKKYCRVCGLSYEAFYRGGGKAVGCPACYGCFSEEIRRALARLHGTATYAGSLPRKILDRRRREAELEKITDELHEAVGREDFESALALRDRIKIIRQTLSS